MKKGIFSTWFREIATIIFTQTIQAFLLAIVMSIIISALGKTTGSGDVTGSTAAAGLLAIIALSQFGKFELLIKNIFGVTSGVADTSMNAGFRGLTAGKLMVARGVRRLGDNGKKLASGIASFKTGSEMKNMNAELGKLKSEKLPGLNDATAATSGDSTVTGATGNSAGTGLNISNADIVAAITAQTEEIRRQTQAQERNRQDDKIAKLEEKLDEANKKRSEQRKAGLSGIAESAGAFYGGSAGLAVGLARGEEIDATMLGGMAAGDFVADAAVDGLYAGKNAVKGAAKTITNPARRSANVKAMNANVEKSLKAQNEATQKVLADLDKQIKQAEGEQQKQLVKEYDAKVDEYNKYIKSMTSDKSLKPAANKALGGNTVTRKVKNKLGVNKSNYKDSMKNYDVGKDL